MKTYQMFFLLFWFVPAINAWSEVEDEPPTPISASKPVAACPEIENDNERLKCFDDKARKFDAIVKELETLIVPDKPVEVRIETLSELKELANLKDLTDNSSQSDLSKKRDSPPIKPIKGAFGKELGQVYDPFKADDLIGNTSASGKVAYFFKPQKYFRWFDSYYLFLETEAKKIYRIVAEGNFPNNEKCKKEKLLLEEALKVNYGRTNKLLYNSGPIISRKGRTIHLICKHNLLKDGSTQKEPTIQIIYTDLDLLNAEEKWVLDKNIAEENRFLKKKLRGIDLSDL